MSFEFGKGSLSMQIPGSNKWEEIGEVKATIITGRDGETIYVAGEPEDVFDLRLTSADKKLLGEMQISK